MALVRVTTPVPDYSGSVGGVVFANGEALVDDEVYGAELGYFARSGYIVHENVEEVAADEAGGDDPEPDPTPARNASTETWRAWAAEHGGMSAEDAGALSRDELVARFADSEENS